MSDQNIDKKLRKILETNFAAGVHNDDPRYESHIAQIKQAFADEGYVQPIKLDREGSYKATGDPIYLTPILRTEDEWEVRAKDKGLMTGQEWYDRFEKEYLSLSSPGQMHADDLTEEDVLEAAQRASGITS